VHNVPQTAHVRRRLRFILLRVGGVQVSKILPAFSDVPELLGAAFGATNSICTRLFKRVLTHRTETLH
ncbi:MAG: hypothetical protein ACREQ5_32070, partial [Candidatus Dormibacteria bacterium]